MVSVACSHPFPRGDLEEAAKLEGEVWGGCAQITVELVNYKRNGEKFWNLLSMTPVFDSSGSLMSFIGVQSDITELIRRKEAEKELHEAKVSSRGSLGAHA